mgnify:CR=1 FL=1
MDTNPKPLPEGLKTEAISSFFGGKTVEGINVCHLLEVLYPGYWKQSLYLEVSYEASRVRIESWCREHGAHYYARGREEFSEGEARAEAEALGLTRVVLEDLS